MWWGICIAGTEADTHTWNARCIYLYNLYLNLTMIYRIGTVYYIIDMSFVSNDKRVRSKLYSE